MKTETVQRCNVCDATSIETVDADFNIARCRTCSYVFESPRPTTEEIVKFYSRPTQYDSWLKELSARDRLWKRRLRKLRSTKKAGSLLDVGTGIGQFLAVAQDSYAEICGTEVSSTAVQVAKEKYNVRLFQGEIENIDMQGRVFDNITLFHVLEHVPDPKSVLKKCHALLSTQGILVIAVPNDVVSLRAFVRRTLVRTGLEKRRFGKMGLPRLDLSPNGIEVHLSHFTPKALHQLLETTGFSIITRTLDPYYIATGLPRLKTDAYYYCCLLFHKIFNLNIYDTMLIIACKC